MCTFRGQRILIPITTYPTLIQSNGLSVKTQSCRPLHFAACKLAPAVLRALIFVQPRLAPVFHIACFQPMQVLLTNALKELACRHTGCSRASLAELSLPQLCSCVENATWEDFWEVFPPAAQPGRCSWESQVLTHALEYMFSSDLNR